MTKAEDHLPQLMSQQRIMMNGEAGNIANGR
jgi:hypothetical protein